MAPSRWRQLLLCVSCLWHRSEDGSGWVLLAALNSGTPSSSIISHAGETLMHCPAVALPVQGLATLQQARGCACVGPHCCPQQAPIPQLPCPLPHCHAVGALEQEDVATQGTRTDLKRERQGAITCVMESCSSLSPWLGVLGESCPHSSQLNLPGSSTSSPWLVVGTKPALLAGLSSCPSGARKAPCAGDMGTCPAGPAGFSSLTAAGDATTAKRCHFLQLGFYRVGGRGAFIELCLHFWSFLRDTFSHERPAWSHGGL